MKTKRRHELQTNQLADSLAHGIDAVKPYTRVILGLLLATVVLGCTFLYFSAQWNSKQDQAWDDYVKAMIPEPPSMDIDRKTLATLAENSPAGIRAGEWAKLAVADLQLAEGTNQLFVDRTEGTQQLHRAVDMYETALLQVHDPLLKQRALFGLARANEALGELETAQQQYAQLQSDFPDSAYVREAQRREDDLKKDSTRQFYDWFAKYDPQKDASRLPGKPGQKPEFMGDSLEDELKRPSPFDKFPPGDEADAENEKESKSEPKKEEPDATPDGKDASTPQSKADSPTEPESSDQDDVTNDDVKKGDVKKNDLKKDASQDGDSKNSSENPSDDSEP